MIAAMTTNDRSHDRHFGRRMKAAKEGLHLPSEEELLRGMGFFRDDLEEDVREYADRFSRRIRRRRRSGLGSLADCLEELTVEQSEDGVRCFGKALKGVEDLNGFPAESCRLRCQIYLASFGDPQAAAAIAGEAASLALKDIEATTDLRTTCRALAWGVMARTLYHTRKIDRSYAPGRSLFRTLRQYQAEFEGAIRHTSSEETPKPEEVSDAGRAAGLQDRHDDTGAPGVPDSSVVVIPSIGNESTSEGKRVVQEYRDFVRRRLPLPVTPDLVAVRASLAAEFPYAQAIIDTILGDLVGRDHVRLRPTILLGPPGCGKTRFAKKLVEELKAPSELVSCSGLSDSALGGTPRRWSSGEPSLAVMAVRRHASAGPAIILDEIEKVGSSRHNGNVHDVLVGLFERETSSSWFDPYVEASCDLSHLTWLMTANEVASIPAVLRDRCRIVRFPVPGKDHIPMLAKRILERLYVDAGHDPRWATPLEAFEIATLEENWPGGSIRRLERLVEGLVAARERHRASC